MTEGHCKIMVEELAGFFGIRVNWGFYQNAFQNLSDDRFTELIDRYKSYAIKFEAEKMPSPKQLLAFYVRSFHRKDFENIPAADWQKKTTPAELMEDFDENQRTQTIWHMKRGIEINGDRWLKEQPREFEGYCNDYDHITAIYGVPTKAQYRAAVKNTTLKFRKTTTS